MSTRKFHGILMANGGTAQNFHYEQLAATPTLTNAGRFWVNTTSKDIEYSGLDAGGGVVLRTLASVEKVSADLTALETSVNSYTDGEIATVTASVAALGNAINYVSTLDADPVEANAFDLETLPAADREVGDYFKITTSGYLKYLDPADGVTYITFHVNQNDGIVKNTDSHWDVIDNTNSSVAGTTDEIVVTGSTETGFTVSLAQAVKDDITANATAIAAETSRATAVEGTLASLTTDAKGNLVAAINEVDANANANTAAIAAETARATGVEGTLASLTTDAKGNLVAAINEVDANADANAVAIAAETTRATGVEGTLASLTTTEKGSLVGAINEVDANTDTNTAAIGTLASLSTTEKGSLVGAINEVDANADANASAIAAETARATGVEGSLASLTTTEKGSLVGAINEVAAAAGSGTGALRTSINDQRGVFTAVSAGTTHSFNHGFSSEDLVITVLVKDGTTWTNDSVLAVNTPSTTTVEVTLVDPAIVKIIVQDVTDLVA